LYAFYAGLKDQIRKVCTEEYLVCGEGDEQGGAWQEKVRYFSNKKGYLTSILIKILIILSFTITQY